MSTRRFSKKSYAVGGAVLGLLVAGGAGVGVAAVALAPGAAATTAVGGCASRPQVTATGSGTANGTPNLLTMQIGVQSTASSAAASLKINNAQAQTLITTLEKGGVKAADIQTSNLSINPNYSNANNPKITGYQVDNDLTVQIYQLSSAGSLIDAAAAKLGNDVTFNGLSFSVSNPTGPSDAAAADAIHQAEAEAKAMARADGTTLGALCSISNQSSSSPPPVEPLPFTNEAAGSAASVPVQAGSEQFTDQVTVKYRLG